MSVIVIELPTKVEENIFRTHNPKKWIAQTLEAAINEVMSSPVKQLRESYGMNKKEFSGWLGCSRLSVSNWEKNPPAQVLYFSTILLKYRSRYVLLKGEPLPTPGLREYRRENQIQEYKDRMGMTWEELAAEMGVTVKTLFAYKRQECPEYVKNLINWVIHAQEEIAFLDLF